MIFHIPGVAGGHTGVGAGGKIAIQIIRLRSGPEGELLVIGIVVGRSKGW
ncbi:MAG: hypothetical protein NTAFB01_08000 [Nitrospira sp.]